MRKSRWISKVTWLVESSTAWHKATSKYDSGTGRDASRPMKHLRLCWACMRHAGWSLRAGSVVKFWTGEAVELRSHVSRAWWDVH